MKKLMPWGPLKCYVSMFLAFLGPPTYVSINSTVFSNIDIEMKVKNIRLIVFAITVMNIRLGKSRLFMKPNFWIM